MSPLSLGLSSPLCFPRISFSLCPSSHSRCTARTSLLLFFSSLASARSDLSTSTISLVLSACCTCFTAQRYAREVGAARRLGEREGEREGEARTGTKHEKKRKRESSRHKARHLDYKSSTRISTTPAMVVSSGAIRARSATASAAGCVPKLIVFVRSRLLSEEIPSDVEGLVLNSGLQDRKTAPPVLLAFNLQGKVNLSKVGIPPRPISRCSTNPLEDLARALAFIPKSGTSPSGPFGNPFVGQNVRVWLAAPLLPPRTRNGFLEDP